VDVTTAIDGIIAKAGIQHGNVLIYIRHYLASHPQLRYRELRYVANESRQAVHDDEFSLLAEVASEYETIPHADIHHHPLDARITVSCFGVHDRLLPAIKQGTMVLIVLALDGNTRSWIHGRLRSENRPRRIIEALL
jgi:thiamine phosphate synthase YjbQ (UPF0047 family)